MNNSVNYKSNYLEVRAALNESGDAYLVHFANADDESLTIPKDVFERLFRETHHEASDAVNESLAQGRPNLKTPKPKAKSAS